MITAAETLRFPFAGGNRITCPDCLGTKVEISETGVGPCAGDCQGRGVVLFVVGPRDEAQRLYETLYACRRDELGRGLFVEERAELRERVRASRKREFS